VRSVSIHYHVEDGSWWAESPELTGWTAAGDSLEEVRDQALSGAKHFAGEPVAISEVFPHSEAG
jgi:predicted RNase H-like HicB family nuclease